MKTIGRSGSLFLFIFLSLSFCEGLNACQGTFTTVDIVAANKNPRDILVSEFASSLEYIKLETSEETLFRYPVVKGTLGDSLILVKSVDMISLFDRQSGGFIKHIGHKGEDPEGFSHSLVQLGFNVGNRSIFARKNIFDLCEYDITTGKLIERIPGPKIPDRDKYSLKTKEFAVTSSFGSFAWMQNQYIVGYFNNLSGQEPLKLVIYNKNGQLIKAHRNWDFFEKKDLSKLKLQSVDFHNYNDELFFKEWYKDTVFKIGIYQLKPHIYFNTGKQSPPYEKQDALTDEEERKYIFIDRIVQDEDFIFFNSRYKGSDQVGIYDVYEKKASLSKTNRNKTPKGFVNDLDNFLPFFPSFINDNGELVGVISAEDVIRWFEENPKKVRLLPEHLKALENLEPEDNPIVMIAKLK